MFLGHFQTKPFRCENISKLGCPFKKVVYEVSTIEYIIGIKCNNSITFGTESLLIAFPSMFLTISHDCFSLYKLCLRAALHSFNASASDKRKCGFVRIKFRWKIRRGINNVNDANSVIDQP